MFAPIYRSENGYVLKEHLETCGGKFMYTSPLILNEIINLFEDLITNTFNTLLQTFFDLSEKNNKYTFKNNYRRLKTFICILVLMSVVHLPNSRSYWNEIIGNDLI